MDPPPLPWDTHIARRLLASIILRALQDLNGPPPRSLRDGARNPRAALRYLSSPAAIHDIAAATGLDEEIVAERLPAVIAHYRSTALEVDRIGTTRDYDSAMPPALRRGGSSPGDPPPSAH